MIRYIYNGVQQNLETEVVFNKLLEKLRIHLSLPETIEVEFKNLHLSVYGETILDHRFKNRIRLNSNLSSKELFKPFIHEVIHLSQTHTGKLGVYRNGTVMWEGKPYITKKPIADLTYKEHTQLPWEQEVVYLQQTILKTILE